MMTVIVGTEMERITSMYMQEAKATGHGGYLVAENKGEEGVKDDVQVSVLGNQEQGLEPLSWVHLVPNMFSGSLKFLISTLEIY